MRINNLTLNNPAYNKNYPKSANLQRNCLGADTLSLSFTSEHKKSKFNLFGKIFSRNDNKTEEIDNNLIPRELTDEEFDNDLIKLNKKIEKNEELANNTKIKDLAETTNKYNIFAFKKYINNKLYKLPEISEQFEKIIPKIDNLDDAQTTDIILDNKKLRENRELLTIHKLNLINKKNTRPNLECTHFIDNFFKDKEVYNNDCLLNNINVIANFIHNKNNSDLAYNVLFDKDFANNYLNEPYTMELSEPYIKNHYNVKLNKSENESLIINLKTNNDNGYDVISTEAVYKTDGEVLSIKKDSEGKKFVSVIKNKAKTDILSTEEAQAEQKNTSYDADGNRQYTEIIRPLKNNTELYRVIIAKPNQKPIMAYRNDLSTGNLTIDKDFESSDNDHFILHNDINKNFKCEIIDSNGEVLCSVNRTFEKIDENNYRTTLNDRVFDVNYSDEGITIRSKVDDEVKEQKLSYKNDLDKTLEPLYKQMPADYLLKLKKSRTKVKFDPHAIKANGEYLQDYNTIVLSGKYGNNPYVLAHEMGHVFDVNLDIISTNYKLFNIFNKELAAYKANSTHSEGEVIDYFTTLEHINANNCVTEVVAETAAIMSGVNNTNDENIKLREVVLEKNFPKTIAYIANKLNSTEDLF